MLCDRFVGDLWLAGLLTGCFNYYSDIITCAGGHQVCAQHLDQHEFCALLETGGMNIVTAADERIPACTCKPDTQRDGLFFFTQAQGEENAGVEQRLQPSNARLIFTQAEGEENAGVEQRLQPSNAHLIFTQAEGEKNAGVEHRRRVTSVSFQSLGQTVAEDWRVEREGGVVMVRREGWVGVVVW